MGNEIVGAIVGFVVGAVVGFIVGGPAGAVRGAVIGAMIGYQIGKSNRQQAQQQQKRQRQERLEEQIRSKDRQIDQTKAENRVLVNRLEGLQTENRHLQVEIGRQQARIQEIQVQKAHFRDKIKIENIKIEKNKAYIGQLNQQIVSARLNNHQLLDQIRQENQRGQQLAATYEELKRNYKLVKEAVANVQADIEKGKDILKQENDRHLYLKRQHLQLTKEISKLEQLANVNLSDRGIDVLDDRLSEMLRLKNIDFEAGRVLDRERMDLMFHK